MPDDTQAALDTSGDSSGNDNSSGSVGDTISSLFAGGIQGLNAYGAYQLQQAQAKHIAQAGTAASAVPENSVQLPVGQTSNGTNLLPSTQRGVIAGVKWPTWALVLAGVSTVVLVVGVTIKLTQ
jgi:hypothetical protein